MLRSLPCRAAVCVLFVAALAACGDDDSSDEASSSTTASTTAAPVELEGPAVRIGFLTTGEGALAAPDAQAGADAAETYVNEVLGGVAGHPIELVACSTDGSPESTIDCTNTVIEAGVVAVVDGLDLGTDAGIPLLAEAGIPITGHSTQGAQQQANENAYFFSAAAPIAGAVAINTLADLGAEHVAVAAPDVPPVRAFIETGLTPAATAKGLEVELVAYNPASPDFTALVTTAKANGSDAIFLLAAEPGCTALVTAANQLQFEGPILVGTCTDYIEELGVDAGNTYTAGNLWYPAAIDDAPDAKADEVQSYLDAMAAADSTDSVSAASQGTFEGVVDVARILDGIDGEITAASVTAALSGLTDFDTFMGQTLSCTRPPFSGQSGCGTAFIMYEVNEDGELHPYYDGFVDAQGNAQS